MSFLYTIAVVIDSFNSPALAAGLVVAGAGFVFLHSQRHALALILSCASALVLSTGLKVLFAVPRLEFALVAVTGYRFPSQHALAAGAFFGSLCLSALCLLRSPRKKVLAVALSLVAISTVAWSRVFLRVHLPTDVIVGLLLGIAVSLIVYYAVLWKNCCRAK